MASNCTIGLLFFTNITYGLKKFLFKNKLDETVKIMNLLKFRLSNTLFFSEIGSMHERSAIAR